MKNKKNLIIIGIILLVLIIISLLVFLPKKETLPKVEELDLEELLTDYGKNYYENYYYNGLTNKEILPNYKDSGIRISLTNLEVITPISDQLKKQLENENCDYDKTYVVYYPKENYKVQDYDIKLELSCKNK